MKRNFVSVIYPQLTNSPDTYIQPEYYYNFSQYKFSSGELNKSFTKNFKEEFDMKKCLVIIIAVIVIAFISANCSGPSVVYTGELQKRDTIVIVTQPGFTYEVRVIPVTVNLKDDEAKYLPPQIFTRSGKLVDPIADSDGGSYVLGASRDTIHKFTVIKDGIRETITCYEADTTVFIDCNGGMYIPCTNAIDDSTINCK